MYKTVFIVLCNEASDNPICHDKLCGDTFEDRKYCFIVLPKDHRMDALNDLMENFN